MFGPGASPGSLSNQVGRSLIAIREAVQAQDVMLVADHITFLVAIASPKLEPGELEGLVIREKAPGKDKSGEQTRKFFTDCMRVLSALLQILSERGYYAYKEREYTDGGLPGLTDAVDELGVQP